jgi:uncharacterized protein YbjT (DUF2867 family)
VTSPLTNPQIRIPLLLCTKIKNTVEMASQYVLVTGATGFIGAHIVDTLLSRGVRVRGATRSLAKGDAMIKARPQYAGQLEFVEIGDFEKPAGLLQAVQGVDGVIHTASVSRSA